MIKLESIAIRHFRGIKNLDLELGCQNYAIQGPNGSGKSGVVDAIEFALSGTISRLAGPGTAGLTLTRHGPHVDSRDNPRAGRVVLKARVLKTNDVITIERGLDAPGAPTIAPDNPAVRELLAALSKRPEFVLSRRDIVKFILVEPGRRASEIQALLRLDRLEDLRSAFRATSTQFTKHVSSEKATVQAARDALSRSLVIDGDLTRAAVLSSANRLRSYVGADQLAELTANTNLSVQPDSTTTVATVTSKAVAIADINALRPLFHGQPYEIAKRLVQHLSDNLTEIQRDPALAADLERSHLIELGLKYFNGQICPLCDTAWREAEFRALLDAKLERLKAGRARADAIVAAARELMTRAATLERLLASTQVVAIREGLAVEAEAMKARLADVAKLRLELDAPLLNLLALPPSEPFALTELPDQLRTALRRFGEVVAGLPDGPSPTEARSQLDAAQMRYQDALLAERRLRNAEKRASRAKTVLETYDRTVEGFLNGLYGEIEDRFAAYYKIVNGDDEASFEARLRHEAASVDLSVDFYGKGLFPPSAYHSEGHQDGMGLCLYLALMEQIHGGGFTFAILDDVIMSVDAGHRKHICKLLSDSFGSTQFVLTTHDKVWLGQMRTAGLISKKRSRHFSRWSVDHGPYVLEKTDAWTQLEKALDRDDVPEAAWMLRHELEGVAFELADRFGAEAPIRIDSAYDLGELLPRVTARFKELLVKATNSAHSWARVKEREEVEALRERFRKAAETSNLEAWAVNPLVHYNEWANFTPNEFRHVAAAFRELLDCMRCPNCAGWLFLEPDRGTATALRCECSDLNFNFLMRPKS